MYGLPDRSSRPRRLRCPTPEPQIDAVVALRRQRWPVLGSPVTPASAGPLSAVSCVISSSTASVIYEHEAPGDMLHLDIKKLGRFTSGIFRTTGLRARPSAWWRLRVRPRRH